MEALLYLALSHENFEMGVDVRKELAENNMIGVRVAAIVEPELGAQTQFYLGGQGKHYFWDVAAGVVYFREPFPAGGSELNYALSVRAGTPITESVDVYVEARHWSNGSVIHRKPSETNPGWNGVMAGIGYSF